MRFKNTAEKDRHYICEIGRLFWGDDKQCYAADAVYRRVKESKIKLTEEEIIERIHYYQNLLSDKRRKDGLRR